MTPKRIINPNNGESFFILDNGKPYWEVLPTNVYSDRMKSSPVTDGILEQLENGAKKQEDQRAEVAQHMLELKRKIKSYESTVGSMQKEINDIKTENAELKKLKNARIQRTSNIIVGMIYAGFITALLMISGLIKF